MASVIRLKKNYIAIPFVDENDETKFELRFSMTDESIDNLYAQYDKLDTLIKEVEATAGENDYKAAKKVLKHAIDGTIGEGSFDKIYNDCQSVIITTEYYAEVILIIRDELQKSKARELEKEVNEEYFN